MANLNVDSTFPSAIPLLLVSGMVVVAFIIGEYYSERRRRYELGLIRHVGTSSARLGENTDASISAASFANFLRRHFHLYGLVIFFVALSAIIRWQLTPVLQGRLPYTFFLPAVMLTAQVSGVWKILLSLVLGFLAGTWFFAEPSSWMISDTGDWWAAGLYLFIGLSLVWFMKSDQTVWLRTLHSDLDTAKQMQVARQKKTTGTSPDDTRDLLAAIVESAQDAIFSLSLDGRVMTWNVAAERHFQIPAREAIGKPLTSVVPTGCRVELQNFLIQMCGGQTALATKTRFHIQEGSSSGVWLTFSPVNNTSGKLVGASVIVREAVS
jgi:PAS domain S-box-containing protein